MYKLGIGIGVCVMGFAIGKLIATTTKTGKVTNEDRIAAICMVAVVAIAVSEIL